MAIQIQLCKSSASQVGWSPAMSSGQSWGTDTIFHPQQYLLILFYLSTKKGFRFNHQTYDLAVGEHCSELWEGGCGAERTVSLIPLQCCALCCCAGGTPPVAVVQREQVRLTSCMTWPNSSPWHQQNETASHVQIHPHDLPWSHCQGIASRNIRWRQRMNDLTDSIWQLHFGFNQIQVREEGYGYTRSWLLPLARQHSCWSSFLWKQLDSDWKTLGSWIRQRQSQQQELNMPLKYLDTVTRTCLVSPADNNRKGSGDAQSWKRHWTFRAWLCSMEYWQTGCPALTEEVGLINGRHVSLLEKCFTQAN